MNFDLGNRKLTIVLYFIFQTGTAELDITENEESTIKKNLKQFRDYIQNCVKTPDLIGYFNAFTKGTLYQLLLLILSVPNHWQVDWKVRFLLAFKGSEF